MATQFRLWIVASGSVVALPAQSQSDGGSRVETKAGQSFNANKEGNCANRVLRNGTFMSNPYMQRSARRGAPYPATQRGRNYRGFRAVAKTMPEAR